MRTSSFLIAATLSLGLGTAAQAAPVSLSTLLSGGTLVQGDATFENFDFLDFLVANNITPEPGDRSVSADQIGIETSATADTVSLTATIDPIIISGTNTITGPDGSVTAVLPSIFGFLLDFDISISGSSSRQITGVSLIGDVSATGPGNSQVDYRIDDPLKMPPDLEVFEEGFFGTSQPSDSTSFAPTAFMALFGDIQGGTFENATAGLSTFTLTFDLQDPAAVIPLPAGLPLLLAGVGALALFRRRKT